MKRILKKRPTPALAVSFIALFVALGGVSYGVATGSIDSREIKDSTIRSQDMSANSITEREIRRRSLDGTDIKIERVGGDAVKEQVLESEKIGKVPNASNADVAAAAGVANDLSGPGAAKYTTRWALINELGQIERQTGGFSLVNCYQANANCYINAGEDVTNNGVSATIAIGNTDGSNILSGEVGVAPCFLTSVLCGPMGTDTNNGGNNGVIVVAPRASDGNRPGDDPADDGMAMNDNQSAPGPGAAARFYVFVTGSESQ